MNKSPLSETEWNIIKVVWAQVARSAGEIIEALDAPFRRVKRLPSQSHRQAAPIRPAEHLRQAAPIGVRATRRDPLAAGDWSSAAVPPPLPRSDKA